MVSKMQILCVVKVDTFDGKTYEAQLLCHNREDGYSLVRLMEQRSSINGFEVVGCLWKPSCRLVEELGEDGVHQEFRLGNDLFITFKAAEDDMCVAMENLLWDINSVMK